MGILTLYKETMQPALANTIMRVETTPILKQHSPFKVIFSDVFLYITFIPF